LLRVEPKKKKVSILAKICHNPPWTKRLVKIPQGWFRKLLPA